MLLGGASLALVMGGAQRPHQLGDVDTGPTPLPRWYKAVMFGMLILGLLWIVVYYLTQGLLPIPQLAGGNILVGFGIALVGFLMMTRWSE